MKCGPRSPTETATRVERDAVAPADRARPGGDSRPGAAGTKWADRAIRPRQERDARSAVRRARAVEKRCAVPPAGPGRHSAVGGRNEAVLARGRCPRVARGPSGRTSRSGRPASDRPSGREGEPPTRHRRGATPPSSVRCKSARDARLGGAGSPAARRAKEQTRSSPDGGEHPTAASGGRRAACSEQRMRRRRTAGSTASDRRPRRRKGADEPSRHYRWLAPRFGRRAAKEWPVDSRCASPAPITRKRLRTASRARR
jgi:hypothetical protein